MKIIGITQRVHLYKPYNEIWECLDSALSEFVANIGFVSVALSHKQEQNIEVILGFCDGVILSGGNDIGEYEARDSFECKLLESALKANKKVLGICRGMQVIARYFGINLGECGHKIGEAYALSGDFSHEVHCYHKYCIDFDLNAEILRQKGFEIVATSTPLNAGKSEIEAFRGQNLLAIAWHPEREKGDSIKNAEIIREFLQC